MFKTMIILHGLVKPHIETHIRPVARGQSGGSADPPLRTKGPLFGTSRVKLLRPIIIIIIIIYFRLKVHIIQNDVECMISENNNNA